MLEQMYKFYPKNTGQETTRSPLHQFLLIMKITTFLLVAVILHVSATSLAQKVTLVEKNAPLTEVFDKISTQTGYDFLFTSSDLKNAKPVTIDTKNEELQEVLQKIFAGQPLDFTIEDKSVVIKEKQTSLIDQLKNKIKAELAQLTITGNVTDETGQPLPGVTVKVKGTNTGTQTDSKGTYTLTVPDDNTVMSFSYVGYETQELRAKDIASGSAVILKASTTNLKEVVVNKGYYTERQELSTGSVSRVTAKEIGQQPVSDPIQTLEGRVAGLSIQQTSGIAGASSIVRIRGQNSITNGSDPLYIVDGVPFTSTAIGSPTVAAGALNAPSINPVPNQLSGLGNGLSPFNMLNPQDIESIEVLKDADATAIYGSRGANGVILITTKKGKAGQTITNVNAYTGVGRVAREMDLLNTEQYVAMRRQALKNDGQTPGPTDYDLNGTWDLNRYTDWQKTLIGGTSHFTDVHADISGGNTNTQFMIGAGYTRQSTVFPTDLYDQKASFKVNLNHISANGKFRTNLSAQYVNDDNRIPSTDLTGYALNLAPNAPALYDANGQINWQGGTWNNPLALFLQKNQAVSNNLTSSLVLSYDILPGLQFKSNIGYTRIQTDQDDQTPAAYYYGTPSPYYRNHVHGSTFLNTLIIEPQLSYQQNIGKGELNLLVGGTFQSDHNNSLSIVGYNFSSDEQINNISAASNSYISGNNGYDYRYNAIFGRLGYTWEDKYLLNITARRDGSSRFGPANRFGNFGAIGAGWIFSKEKFISDNWDFLSFGKLRASYGVTGNDQIGNYQYLSLYNYDTSTSYQGITTIYPTSIANAQFGWEVVKKLEASLELGFLKDRILLEATYYRNRTGNQLVGQPLPTTDGFTTVQANLPAVVQNKGIEFQINSVNIKQQDFSWRSSFNISLPNNKLISFPNLASDPAYSNNYEVGKSIYYSNRLFHYTGIDPQTGLYSFLDINHDGNLSSTIDGQLLKSVEQKFYGGFGNNISYKNWQLDLFVQFVKQTGKNYFTYFQTPGIFVSQYANQPTAILTDIGGIKQYTANGIPQRRYSGKPDPESGECTKRHIKI